MHEDYELQKDVWSQFHQHFMHDFFCQYPFTKKSQSQTLIRENLCTLLSNKKQVHKMLMKLTLVCKISRGVQIDSVLIILFIFTKLRWNFAFSLPKGSKNTSNFFCYPVQGTLNRAVWRMSTRFFCFKSAVGIIEKYFVLKETIYSILSIPCPVCNTY